ncbi:MAG: endonuclease/exonuclease/phosphatase family protein [Polyangiaceae bacterium]
MSFRVATLNIWNRMGPWDERLTAILAGVEKIQPDILGLQEVIVLPDAFDQAKTIAGKFGMQSFFGRNDSSEYPMGNAILSKWPIVKTAVFPLPRVDTDEHRTLVFAEVQAPHGIIPVFCTHLNWKLDEGHVREIQIRFVTDKIRELASISGLSPILVGDMNAEPDSDEMRFLRGLTKLAGNSVYFADCFGIVGDGTPGYTYSRKNPYAAPLREPSRRIDFIYVRGPDEQGRGEPLDARVCFDEPVNGVFASDHFGVVANISTE